MISPPFFPRCEIRRAHGGTDDRCTRVSFSNFHASRELEGMESSQLTAEFNALMVVVIVASPGNDFVAGWICYENLYTLNEYGIRSLRKNLYERCCEFLNHDG